MYMYYIGNNNFVFVKFKLFFPTKQIFSITHKDALSALKKATSYTNTWFIVITKI